MHSSLHRQQPLSFPCSASSMLRSLIVDGSLLRHRSIHNLCWNTRVKSRFEVHNYYEVEQRNSIRFPVFTVWVLVDERFYNWVHLVHNFSVRGHLVLHKHRRKQWQRLLTDRIILGLPLSPWINRFWRILNCSDSND